MALTGCRIRHHEGRILSHPPPPPRRPAAASRLLLFLFILLSVGRTALGLRSPSPPGIAQERGPRNIPTLYSSASAAAAAPAAATPIVSPPPSAERRRARPGETRILCSLPYDSAVRCLRAYRSFHGDLVIPRRYIVPSHTDDGGRVAAAFPEEWRGAPLAETVYTMTWWKRHICAQPDRVEELNSLGFVWERLQSEWNLVVAALAAYRTVHGDLMIPSSFVVPHGDASYLKGTWGIALGNTVYRIRSRQQFVNGDAERIHQLDMMGFVWDVSEHLFERYMTALRLYRSLGPVGQNVRTNVLQVPSRFVVPSGGEWPPELWGYPLGDRCAAVRQKGLYVKNSPMRRRALEDLGFQFGGNASLGWLNVIHAAAIYSEIGGRLLDVPQSFVVPRPSERALRRADIEQREDRYEGWVFYDDDWPWPEYLWGFPLGQRLKDVRIKGLYLRGANADERRAQLDALGFVWKPAMGRRFPKTLQPGEAEGS